MMYRHELRARTRLARCWALTVAGRPCRATPRAGAALCHHHQRTGVRLWGGPLDGQAVILRHASQRTIAVRLKGPEWILAAAAAGEAPGHDVVGLYVLEPVPPIGVGPQFCWRAVSRVSGPDAQPRGDGAAEVST